MSTTTTFGVDGMTCGHCVQHVTTELTALPGVTGVDIALVVGGSSQVTVTSDAPLADEAVAGAVDEAGYALTPRRSLL
ncbi:MAG TPA: heavy-metal-associated domain-containing protein [Cellulomonas sp.]|nr:heavy-metal-associated domain-containing protein [Cellulomonas sp.]